MDTFVGSLDALKGLVEKTGHRGAWSVIAHGYEFRSNDGVVLDWFPSLSNKIHYQGPIEARARFRHTLAAGNPRARSSAARPRPRA